MSVKIFYDTPSGIQLGQTLGGFCYCRRLGVFGKPTDKKPYNDSRILIDLADPKQAKSPRDNLITSTIDFGIVPVETSVSQDFYIFASTGKSPKTLKLQAQSTSAEQFDRGFRIVFPADDLFPDLACGDNRNVGRKNRKLKFRLYFEPEIPAMHYSYSFIIMADNVPIRVDCQGLCDGPSVCFSENQINFGGQYFRDESSTKVKMTNASACEAKFQFEIDNVRSPFKICPTCGVIPPFSSLVVDVYFLASQPHTYYKRVMCLIHHHHPQYLDLIGLCIPRPFFISSPIDFGLSTSEARLLPLPSESNDEYFRSHEFWGVKLSHAALDFGYRDLMSNTDSGGAETKLLSLTSDLPYDVIIEWVADPTGVFQVTPDNTVLPAYRSAIANVTFNPTFPDTFYNGLLECYIRPTEYTWPVRYGPPWIYTHKENLLDPNVFTNEQLQHVNVRLPADSPELVPLIDVNNGIPEARSMPKLTEARSIPQMPPVEDAPVLVTPADAAVVEEEEQLPPPGPPPSVKKAGKEKGNKKGKTSKKAAAAKEQSIHTQANTHENRHDHQQGTNSKNPSQGNFKSKKSLAQAPAAPVPETVSPAVVTTSQHSEIPYSTSVPRLLQIDEASQVSKIWRSNSTGQANEANTLPDSKGQPNQQPGTNQKRCSTFLDKPFTMPLILTIKCSNSNMQEIEVLGPITHLVDMLENPSTRLSVTSTNIRKLSLASQYSESQGQQSLQLLSSISMSVPTVDDEEMHLGDDATQTGGVSVWNLETLKEDTSPAAPPPVTAELSKDKSAPGCLPQELALPLCLTVRVSGHTYQRCPPVTRLKVPKTITMYPTWPMSQICRTLIFKNNNDLPVSYDASALAEDSGFKIKPSKGVIPGNFHQIMMVQMTPKLPETSRYSQNCDVTVNIEDKNDIMLRGIAESPVLDLLLSFETDVEGKNIIFPETIPGCSTRTYLRIRNPSRFHYRYEITPNTARDGDIFQVSPAEGCIVPYQAVGVDLQFRPTETYDYYSQWKFTFHLMRSRVETRNLITSYIYEIPFVATCRDCILTATPHHLDFELVQIFNTKTMTLTLENKGHASVNVKLRAMHEEWLQWYPSEEITIEPKRLILHGMESAEISITVRPDRTNFQRFYIDYELELNDTTKDVKDATEHKGPKPFHRICEVNFVGDHAIFCVTDILMISRHPVWDAGQSWSMFSIDKFNHVLKPTNNQNNRSHIPSIPTVSFRFPPATLDSEASLFNILLSNRDNLMGTWQMMPSPPRAWIKSLFSQTKRAPGYDTCGTEDEDFLKEIWKQKFMAMSEDLDDERTAEVEKDSSPPSSISLMNMLIQHLADMEYFYVSPIGGQLTPGEQMQISLRYSYKRVGKHQMTVLFRVHPGVFVWVAMKGMTLPPDTAFVQHMHKEEMILHPVSLADMDPPIQLFWMYNGGEASAEFQVVTKPFEEYPDKNYGHEVFECLNPVGVIGGRSWTPIRIRFSPIEIKEYSIPLIVAVNGKLTRVVLLKGIPSFSQGLLIRPEVTGFHVGQKFTLINPLIPIMMSPAHVMFKKFIPTGQKATSVVFVTNLSHSNTMSYTWPDVPIDGGGSITFEPDTGLLQPNEERACKVIVAAGQASTTFSRIIRIAFVDETLLADYEAKMRDRDACRARLLSKNIRLENLDGEVNRQFGPEPIRPPSFSRLISVTAYISSSFGILNTMDVKEHAKIPAVPRCKPLPPPLPNKQRLVLPPFIQQLSREVISSILWDLMNSDSMESFIKDGAGFKAPLYFEYKRSEEDRQRELRMMEKSKKLKAAAEGEGSDEGQNPGIPVNGAQEILEQVVFNMVQEVASSFEPRKIPEPLKPVQPRELVNVKRYRSSFL